MVELEFEGGSPWGWSRILRAAEAPREGGAAYRVGVWGAQDRALKPQLPRTPGQVAPAPLPRSLCRPGGNPVLYPLGRSFEGLMR